MTTDQGFGSPPLVSTSVMSSTTDAFAPVAGWAENSGSGSCRLHDNPEVSPARPETPPQTQSALEA